VLYRLGWFSKSVSHQVSFSLVLILFFALLFFAIYFYKIQSNDLNRTTQQMARQLLSSLNVSTSKYLHFNNYFSAWDDINNQLINNKFQIKKGGLFKINEIALIDTNGDTFAHSSPANNPVKSKYQGTMLEKNNFKESKNSDNIVFSWTKENGQDAVRLYTNVEFQGRSVGILILQLDLSILKNHQQKLVYDFVKYFIVILVIAIIIGALLGRWVSYPAYTIEASLNRMGTGTLEIPELHHRKDEYNKLALAIERIDKELSSSKSTLANSEAKFRGILESAADGMLLINSSGKIDLINQSLIKMTGYTEKELVGQTVELLIPKRFNQHLQLRENYCAKPELRQMGIGKTLYALRKNGTEFPVEISLNPVTTDKSLMIAAMIQDISLRKQAEQEKEELLHTLEYKNAELERFTYTASHDLKSPLVTISGFIGLLKKDISQGDSSRIQADLDRITEATLTMQELLDDLLEISRIGRKIFPHTKISIDKIVKSVKELLAIKIKETKANITIEKNLPCIIAEEPRIKEVFLNLIDNALKYKSKNCIPKIYIGVRYENSHDTPIFYVEDNGIGIDSRYHDKIFGLFERMNNDIDGTGVGLAIVKRIIEVHEGKLWVESNVTRQGSRFCFTVKQTIPESIRSII
jgi:PAS domain S-box-containing protein